MKTLLALAIALFAGQFAQANQGELICRVKTSLKGNLNITEVEKRAKLSLPSEGLSETVIHFETAVGIEVEGALALNSIGDIAFNKISFYEKESKLAFLAHTASNETTSTMNYPKRLDQDGNETNRIEAVCFTN